MVWGFRAMVGKDVPMTLVRIVQQRLQLLSPLCPVEVVTPRDNRLL